jgi:DNA primase
MNEWLEQRVENIHQHVSAHDVLTRHGVGLRRGGSVPEQICCPFHSDSQPSARYYPEADSPSGLYCFACHQRWDAIALWKQFTGTEKFSEVLRQIERAFGLRTPEVLSLAREPEVDDGSRAEVEQLFKICEDRMRQHRDRFEMMRHVRLGQVLDHQHYYWEHGLIDAATVTARLQAILAKIRDAVRASP